MPDARPRSEVLQGTLEMLVLNALSLEPMHGWGISIRLRQISGEVFDVNQGSLYPALHRLERRGWISRPAGRAKPFRPLRLEPEGLAQEFLREDRDRT